MHKDTVMVFTVDSFERIIKEGGTSAWHLDPKRVEGCEYVVCTRKTATSKRLPELPLSAFVIGKIGSVVPAQRADFPGINQTKRYLIGFSEFARIQIPDAWVKQMNPVKYIALNSLSIDPTNLNWEPMPTTVVDWGKSIDEASLNSNAPGNGTVTISSAKISLARALGVKPEQVEITIKG